MEQTFKAYYYDGKSAARIEAAISVAPESLLIRRPDGAAIEWKWKDVVQTQGFYENEPMRLEKGVEAIVLENRLFLLHLKKIAPKAAASLSGPSKGQRSTVKIAGLWLIAAGLVMLLYLYGIPGFATISARFIPVSWEEKLGDSIWVAWSKEMRECKGASAIKSAEEILALLDKNAPQHKYKFKVHVVDNNMINAFALPGGHIIIMSGLMEATKTPEEFAGVMAHEMQHVLKRHATRGILQSLSTSMLVTLISGDTGGIAQAVQVMGHLRYSRNIEREADKGGLALLLKAGVDPKGMVDFFKTLEKEYGSTPDTLSYFSTHPLTEERINYLKEQIPRSAKYALLLPGVDWKRTSLSCDGD
ncbi:MAG: M48 family metallopeptidase [Thermodesulfobacteriota bacterium]